MLRINILSEAFSVLTLRKQYRLVEGLGLADPVDILIPNSTPLGSDLLVLARIRMIAKISKQTRTSLHGFGNPGGGSTGSNFVTIP